MTTSAIEVQGVWKEYVIGQAGRGNENLREMIHRLAHAPFRRQTADAGEEQKIWALRDVSFRVEQGEVLGIIGANGAGKSTLLKILSRVTEPTRGRIRIHGRVSSLLEVGTGFHPELSGRENVFLNGAIIGMRRSEVQRKFDEIVDFSGVERFLDTPVKHYSSGMRVRLAFAVAAHLEPEVLILDEVLSVGDAAFQKKSLDRMSRIVAGGRTVILVGHNTSVMRGVCRRVMVLKQGALDYLGDANSAVDRYLAAAVPSIPLRADTTMLARPPEAAASAAARIVRAEIKIPPPHSALFEGDAIEVEFDVAVHAPIEGVVLGWALQRDELRVFESRSIESYGPLPRLEPGQYRFSSTVSDLSLCAGDYKISLGFGDANLVLDYLPEVISFKILPRCAVESRWYEQKSGLISVKGIWSPPHRCVPFVIDHHAVSQ